MAEWTESDSEERRRKPEYELRIVCRLPSEKALQTLMVELGNILYRADPMAAFSGSAIEGQKP